MTESQPTAVGTWIVPQCPYDVEYSTRMMDDIRLAVMDAYFSLPRGGAEIGGILLGRFGGGRVTILDYQALNCEHAFGPSFTLSPKDEVHLQELLAAARKSGATPVGWYHSHTRTEIFLSETDLAVHNRFFPEPWQVALVMKPHTFQPMRCGCFFREADGSIQAESSCKEFTLDALPMRPVPGGTIVPAGPPDPESDTESDDALPAITVAASRVDDPPMPRAAPAPEAEPEPAAEPVPPPSLSTAAEPSRVGRWAKRMLAVVAGLAIGVVGFQTRGLWWPRLSALFTPSMSSNAAFASIGLTTTDADGQLQINWDRFSSAIRQATSGRLSIKDVGPAREFKLDSTRLQNGNFTYLRQGDTVTVVLSLDEPNAPEVHEVSTFVGKLPPAKPTTDSSELRRQRDAAVMDSTRLRQSLADQVERNKKLQKALDDARTQLREQQRRRFNNQAGK